MIFEFLRGIRMLRHRELVRRLGDLWSAEREIEEIRRRNPGANVSSEAKFLVLPGVTLASGAVIGAGNIVNRSAGEYEIWAGNPAAKVGERRD